MNLILCKGCNQCPIPIFFYPLLRNRMRGIYDIKKDKPDIFSNIMKTISQIISKKYLNYVIISNVPDAEPNPDFSQR